MIIEFDNTKIDTSAVLPPLVGMTSIGTVTKVKVIRQGRDKNLKVKLVYCLRKLKHSWLGRSRVQLLQIAWVWLSQIRRSSNVNYSMSGKMAF